ncbi:MAG: tRNA lysidine(34) synthetase TilS [Solirubrobacteraceae bacterium]
MGESQPSLSGLPPDAPLVLLCSGGRDSVCLVHLAALGRPRKALLVLHVNYGLREAAAGDEALVRRLCSSFGLTLEVVRAPPAPATGNLQAWARDLRYGAATRLAIERTALIATGHTASDQVEGVLYRLAASPGRRALRGMPSRQGRLVRPLLASTREQTAAYCTAQGLEWREDASNEDPRFARARARGSLVPVLRELHPAAERNVLRTIEALREEGEVLDEWLAEALGGREAVELDELAALPAAIARLLVMRMAERAAGEFLPGVGGRVAELLALPRASGSLDVGCGVRAEVSYGSLSFSRAAPREPVPPPAPLAVPGRARFGAWEISCSFEPPPAGEDTGLGVLDADALGSGLLVRAWRPGDRMQPRGMGGATKSLADLFGARRVPRAQRRDVPLITCGGEIAWIPGVAASERFRPGAATRRPLMLSARRVD